ncbi:hypothetical protein [Feifania hominis]|uniref:Uncharacterized protein n=1 Tax=Feifania hominis TaxID=2763660 RepID=A0A926DH76_9FIRM|nr:hypothetical protein [Feifania hominis]MBC8537239.1 hypothetical protein [Feifania hominis]
MRKMFVMNTDISDDDRSFADLIDLHTGSRFRVGVLDYPNSDGKHRLCENEVITTELFIEWSELCEPFQTPENVDYVCGKGPGIYAKAKVLAIASKYTLVCEIKGLSSRIIVDDMHYDGEVGDTIYIWGSLSIDYSEHGLPEKWDIPYDPELG